MITMRQTLKNGFLFIVGLMAISPAAFALGRGTSMAFCTDAVYGTCWVSKRHDEPYVSVRFKCQVNAEDHSSQLMAAANFEYALDPDEAVQYIVNQPRPGPIHDSHVYCRRVTGVAPDADILFKRKGNSGFFAPVDDHQTCRIKKPPPITKKKIY
jgi:hypothetical protein